MPRTRRASGKASRVSAVANRRLKKLIDRARDMEEPLYETTELVNALRTLGDGMLADYKRDGRSVVAVAQAALLRLEALERTWSQLMDAGERRAA